MGKSCSIYAHCTNSKGEVVESRLFKDLLHYTSDRSLAKEFYSVGINPTFLEMVQDKADFDENGEITFQSLRKLAKLNIKEEKLLVSLNKDIKAGNYTYTEAIHKLQEFNRNSQFKKEYMATIKSDNKGNYNLSVVKRTNGEEQNLNTEIANRSLQDRIIYYLNKAGVSVSFLEEGDKINGRYSTKNAKRTAEGLYSLIQVANGENVTENLAEEAGHFAVGALGDSPLVQRLLSLLTPEVQKHILGEDYLSTYTGDSARRELAGKLVGDAILGNETKGPWNNLITRIIQTAKRVFYTISGNEIQLAKVNAEKLASSIAEGFLSHNFTGTVEEALKTKETLYSAPVSFNVRTYKKVVNALKLQASEMREISDGLFKRFNAVVNQVEGTRHVETPDVFTDAIALDGIAEAVATISDLLVSEIPELLESVDFDNISDFYANMPKNAKALRAVRTFVRNTLSIVKTIESSISNIRESQKLTGDLSNIILLDSSGNRVSYNLKEVINNIKSIIEGENGILFNLDHKERQYYLKFAEQTLGSKYVEKAATVVFNFNKRGKKLVEIKDYTQIPIENLLDYLEDDISLFERYLASMSNNSDILGQVADKTSKMANKIADDIANRVQDSLIALQSKLKSLGVSNTDIFVERSQRTGKITGNILTPLCWGDYEEDWLEFKQECIEEFNALYPNLEDKSEFEKALLWDSFFKPKVKVWHKGDGIQKGHSVWSVEDSMYIPNNDYANRQYQELPPELRKWLSEYMEIKKYLDGLLPTGSMPHHRMPQFKGTFSNKIRNKRIFERTNKAVIHSVMEEMREVFLEDSDDTDFGSQQTYNTIEEDMFGNQLTFEKEQLNRLPLYGINKLKDTSNISTDLFYSTFAFAGMATQYAAMSQIVDTLEIGRDMLSKRAVEGITDEETNRRDKSRAYTRYIKFLDKQIYGIGTPKFKIGKRLVLNKVLGTLTGLASKYFLGGNVAGGMVNVGTGIIEMTKEVAAGEHFTVEDWAKAHKMYIQGLVSNLIQSASNTKDNKMHLFIRHFNILNENKKEQRDWHTRNSLALNFFNQSLFMPYKAGEHYMASMSYLTLANATKLYDLEGRRISLFNAYEVVPIEDAEGNPTKRNTLQLKGTFLKRREDIDTYNMLKSIASQIEDTLSSTSLFGKPLNLSTEEMEYINSKGYNIADLKDVLTRINMNIGSLIWTTEDESAYMDKAREINNRLHGIYNNQDKTAAHQNIFLNMLLAMRGYALGMLERRIGSSKYSIALGNTSEGSLVTVAKLFSTLFTDKREVSMLARALLLPYSKKTKEAMLNYGFSANQYHNMRRFSGDIIAIALLSIIKALTAKSGGDDEDDEYEDPILGIAYYFSSRLLREQEALTTIRGMSEEVPNLTNITPVGVSALFDISNLAYMAIGSTWASEDDADFFYQSSMEGMYEKYDPKWENKFWRMFPYLRSYYVFENPYKAAESYDYGRKVRK